jgi:acid phosphatase type 7
MPMARGLRQPLAAWAAAAVLLLCVAAPARAQDPVIAAAGDIACDPESEFFNSGNGTGNLCRQKETSDALVRDRLAAVLALGDTQYENAPLFKFQQSYEPSWGRVKPITRPVVGNHEYFDGSGDPAGSGYFDYFNGVGSFSGPAGDRDKGWYSFDIGGWHLVALNSMCSEIGGCGAGSPQERWLRADLAAHRDSCILAYGHHPFYSSGVEGSYDTLRTLWQTLHDAGAELVLSGHDHTYERFVPQDANGNEDRAHGMRQFVVGTGGKNLGNFVSVQPGSEFLDRSRPGVLKLTLKRDGYDWRYAHGSGAPLVDSGTDRCHAPPPPRPASAVTGQASEVRPRSARLNGAVTPGSEEATYYFEYGRAPTYGLTTPEKPLGANDRAGGQVSARLAQLRRGRLYHYRVVARTASGALVPGQDQTFRPGARGGRYAKLVGSRRGLLSYWRLENPGGPFGFDQRGRALAAFERGYVPGQPGALVKEANPAAGFDGVSGEMTALGPEVSRSATIEGWFLWRRGVALMRDDSFLGGWMLAFDREGTLGYRVADKTYPTSVPIDAVRDGQWHHIALTKRGGRVAYYLDGERIDTGTGAPDETATMPWHVMRNGPHREFSEGLADEVAIYGRALPQSAIEHHYDAGKGQRLRKTVGYLPAAHRSITGRVIRRKRSLRRLFEDDEVPLQVRAEGSFAVGGDGTTIATYTASTDAAVTIDRRQRGTLRRLAVQFNGGASSDQAAVTLQVFNDRTRTWEQVAGPRDSLRIDDDLTWSHSASPRSYVSRKGRIRVKVVGRGTLPFRLRSDMIRFVVQY